MNQLKVFLGAILAFTLLAIPVLAQDSVDKVILVTNENYPDAIVSSAVSQKLGVPILLTEKDEIPAEVQSTLQDLGPSEVIVVGGPAVVSDPVIQELKASYNVTRLWGMSRYGTAEEVAGHFWPEGSDRALLVENNLGEERGNVMAAAKNLANGNPVLPVPEDKIPANVLSQLEELNVSEVTVVGTKLTSEMESNLKDIGVTVKKKIQAPNEEELEEEIERETEQEIEANETLVVVAAANFKHTISAPSLPQSHSFLVSSQEEIQDAVDAVNQRNVEEVKVVGKPDLARQIANVLKNETDTEVEFEVERGEEAVAQAAEFARQNLPDFAKKFQRNYSEWQQKIRAAQQKIKQKANDTISKVKTLIQDRNATELQEELQEARQKFSQGEYYEALESARETRQELRENRWEAIRGNWTAVHEEVEDEAEDLKEKTQELSEINREFGQEMRENMTVEERLETIKEFRERKREKVKEIMEAAREKRREEGEEVEDWLEKAEREAEKEIGVEVEGGVARVELEVNGTERKFQLNTTNRGEIIAEIARETGLEQGTIEKNLEMETEKEREVEEEAESEGFNKTGARDEDNETEKSEGKEPEQEMNNETE